MRAERARALSRPSWCITHLLASAASFPGAPLSTVRVCGGPAPRSLRAAPWALRATRFRLAETGWVLAVVGRRVCRPAILGEPMHTVFRILGPFEAEVDERVVTLGRRERALLGVL